ncbi:MAG: WhiB family transcriptional regulator, redox-sensing transcriptional regulator [Frankiaceae bacterium]|jgi:WhiB family redox-sensing transcriptional regulator|nr:WhiB family transcriptional regulator, redox-sensing transcriptional regulator [Frankiaceae bacterium]
MTNTPCTTIPDADVFFPETAEQLALAQSLCARCPVAATCLEQAVTLGVTDGVWGGQLFERGRPVTEKRRPGRPRKTATAA